MPPPNHRRESDLEVNPVREKKLTNVRNTGSEEKVALAPPRALTLEDAIGWGLWGCSGLYGVALGCMGVLWGMPPPACLPLGCRQA
jgi:hypothetical protein